ncbi:lytic transglycosylase domain-containing protein [Candidatus Pacearchaeota archaeon]|nr:lytic transglycosylase domain-containing protein [Candidatus Pacearchaeota archaeon]
MGGLIIGIITTFILLFPKTSYSTVYDDLYKKYSNHAGVDWKLLKAISINESSQRFTSVNEDEGRGRKSYGLMQILYPDTLDFINDYYGYEYTRNDLLNPEINIFLASSYIRYLKTRYNKISDIIASYNAGSVIKRNGLYINQTYVNKILKVYRSI